MGLVSLVVGCQQEIDFSALLFGCCGREAGYGPVNRMAVVLWMVSGAFISGVVNLFKYVDDCMKG
jgi:hypothetical protein